MERGSVKSPVEPSYFGRQRDTQKCPYYPGVFIKRVLEYTSRTRVIDRKTKGPRKRGNIVLETLLRTQMFPCLRAHATFVADAKICVRDAKNVSEFFQKHFASATNVSPFVSWFTRQGSKTFVLLPTRLLAVETLRATMFPRLRGP